MHHLAGGGVAQVSLVMEGQEGLHSYALAIGGKVESSICCQLLCKIIRVLWRQAIGCEWSGVTEKKPMGLLQVRFCSSSETMIILALFFMCAELCSATCLPFPLSPLLPSPFLFSHFPSPFSPLLSLPSYPLPSSALPFPPLLSPSLLLPLLSARQELWDKETCFHLLGCESDSFLFPNTMQTLE